MALRSTTRAARQWCDVDVRREPFADDITRLRSGLNDLGSILAQPAVWAGAEPSQIVSALVDALLGMLHLSFVLVRWSDLNGGPSIEVMRVADSGGGTHRVRETREAIHSWLSAASPNSRATMSVGEVDLSVASARLGLGGEIGIIVAGSQRSDFPAHTERLFLDIAASQATIGATIPQVALPSDINGVWVAQQIELRLD